MTMSPLSISFPPSPLNVDLVAKAQAKLQLALPKEDPKKAAKAVWMKIQEVFRRTVNCPKGRERLMGIAEAKALYTRALEEGKFKGASLYQEMCLTEIECLITPRSVRVEAIQVVAIKPLVVRGVFPWVAQLNGAV